MKLKSNKENLGPSPWLLNYIHFISSPKVWVTVRDIKKVCALRNLCKICLTLSKIEEDVLCYQREK